MFDSIGFQNMTRITLLAEEDVVELALTVCLSLKTGAGIGMLDS